MNESRRVAPGLISLSYDGQPSAEPEPLALSRLEVGLSAPPSALYDFAVVGGGTAGVEAALGAARAGAKVALIERAALGGGGGHGEWHVKKTLREAAALAHALRGGALGATASVAGLDFAAVLARARTAHAEHTAATIERVRQAPLDLFRGSARFVDRETLEVSGTRLRFRRALIATGAHAAEPGIEGLADAGYFTADSLLSLSALPARLVVIGGGARGCELAQVFARLGSRVTLIEALPRLLAREDVKVSELLARVLESEGVRVLSGSEVVHVERLPDSCLRRVHYEKGLLRDSEDCDQVLAAIGLAPNVGGLGLEAAEVDYDKYGVRVDAWLCTSNERIYAAGDACSALQSQRMARGFAQIAVGNALSSRRVRASSLVVTRSTRTQPEVAHVGLSSDEAARRELLSLTVPVWDQPEVGGAPEHFARVHCQPTGRILGVTLVLPRATDSIGEFLLAISSGVKLKRGSAERRHGPHPVHSELWTHVNRAFDEQARKPGLIEWLRGLFGA